ncbi:N-acetyltransferase [Microbispora rosea subsp. aerata]|nr:GNAT family N-acetyltransferase [Microbispora rosea]GGO00812.1 N-acetyltransferase [Microbispora rosea subsp. aerata]GIH56466.1 N-acetyltransferase [Microbispora rosea subsp. aerata]GLJ84367.1 N-acetyltransferase [Microbispora rosea subsp. aerata]
MEQTEPRVADNSEASRFEITVDGALAGFADYRLKGREISLTHTEIDPAFEGRGLGSALVRAALDAARDAGLSVLPFCPFVRRYIERHPGYLDLVPADRRTGFSLGGGEAAE